MSRTEVGLPTGATHDPWRSSPVDLLFPVDLEQLESKYIVVGFGHRVELRPARFSGQPKSEFLAVGDGRVVAGMDIRPELVDPVAFEEMLE